MYSTGVRVQNAFSFFTTVAFVVAALIAVSDFFTAHTPSAKLHATNVHVARGRPHYYSPKKEEYANIRFDLDADLSSLFTWNTKQVFVYVTAEWLGNGTAGSVDGAVPVTQGNQAVIWDLVITNPSADHLQNIGPTAMKKLRRSAEGRAIDPRRGLLTLRNQRPKYQITHPTSLVSGTSGVVLRLHYNVQPWVGVLAWAQDVDFGVWKRMKGGRSEEFDFPLAKAEEKKSRKN